MSALPPSERLVAALIHAECGHACIVADAYPPVAEWAKERGLNDPQWEVVTLPCDRAIERYKNGPCAVCRPGGES